MILTGIGEKNIGYFSHLMRNDRLMDDHIYIGAIEDDTAAGVAEFSSEGNLLIIENLYVEEQFRRRGIADEMLDKMITSARESGAAGVWVSFVSGDESNAFFKKKGFVICEDCGFYRISLEELLESKMAQKLFSQVKHAEADKKRVSLLKSLNKAEINKLKNALISAGCSAAAEMIESLSELQHSIIVYKTPEKRNVSAVLIAELMGDEFVIKYLANICGNPKDFAFILELFRNMVTLKNLGDKTLVFCTADQNIESIVSKLAGKELIPAGNMMVGYKAIEV